MVWLEAPSPSSIGLQAEPPCQKLRCVWVQVRCDNQRIFLRLSHINTNQEELQIFYQFDFHYSSSSILHESARSRPLSISSATPLATNRAQIPLVEILKNPTTKHHQIPDLVRNATVKLKMPPAPAGYAPNLEIYLQSLRSSPLESSIETLIS